MAVKVRQSGQWVEVSGSSTSIPPGGIILWFGASNAIPAGFVLCDGNNSTPDLRDKFIVGAGNNYAVNATGGSANATLVEHSHSINNHTHSFGGTTGDQSRSHTHAFGATTFQAQAKFPGDFDAMDNPQPLGGGTKTGTTSNQNQGHTHNFSGTTGDPSDRGTDTKGSSATNANLPPYYALCYIMKT